jgi:hypothetical protein
VEHSKKKKKTEKMIKLYRYLNCRHPGDGQGAESPSPLLSSSSFYWLLLRTSHHHHHQQQKQQYGRPQFAQNNVDGVEINEEMMMMMMSAMKEN